MYNPQTESGAEKAQIRLDSRLFSRARMESGSTKHDHIIIDPSAGHLAKHFLVGLESMRRIRFSRIGLEVSRFYKDNQAQSAVAREKYKMIRRTRTQIEVLLESLTFAPLAKFRYIFHFELHASKDRAESQFQASSDGTVGLTRCQLNGSTSPFLESLRYDVPLGMYRDLQGSQKNLEKKFPQVYSSSTCREKFSGHLKNPPIF